MKKAFTFTEIMLSLAIIGFITVMVLPIFFNTYGNKVVSAQLKKACTQITNATKHVMTDERANDLNSLDSAYDANAVDVIDENGDPVLDDEGNQKTVIMGFYTTSAGVKTSNAQQGAQYFLDTYFRHNMSNCGSGGDNGCVAASYRTPDNIDVGTVPASFYCIKTTNDSAICMRFREEISRMEVLIDVNGTDRPNVTGSDVYVMFITDDGQLRDLDESDNGCNALSQGLAANAENIIKYSAGCFHRIVSRSWNMRD